MLLRLFNLIFISIIFISSTAIANNSLNKCSNLQPPFSDLSQLILQQTISNPPLEQLCHRAANASKHYNDARTSKTIAELKKFIIETTKSTPKYLSNEHSQMLVAEANRIIQFLGGEALAGSVTGGVYLFQSNEPVSGATINLNFPLSGHSYQTISDENGLYEIPNLPAEGAFIIVATDNMGATGSQQGSLLSTNLSASILLLIDQPGQGNINGHVKNNNLTTVSGALITAIFPETNRNYTTITNSLGFYEFGNLALDGTVIVIAFDSSTGSSSSDSKVINASNLSATVDFTLHLPSSVNSELLNNNFTEGLSGWTSSGNIQIVDRDLVFDLQNDK